MPKVHEFPIIPSLTETTQIYTQRRSDAESPANYRISLSTLVAALESLFNVKRIRGIYDDDADAAAGGVQIGQLYELSEGNFLGMPEGTIKTRRE